MKAVNQQFGRASLGRRILLAVFGIGLVVSANLSGCGKPKDESNEAAGQFGDIAVDGHAQIGSQCTWGYVRKPMPVKVFLHECPVKLKSFDLAEPLRPLYLQADCHEMTISTRSFDGKLENTWLVYPDGSFILDVDGGWVRLRDDGAGHINCVTPSKLHIEGKIACKPKGSPDLDKVDINLNTWWNLGQTATVPSPSPSASPSRSPVVTPSGMPTPITPPPGPSPFPTTRPNPGPSGLPPAFPPASPRPFGLTSEITELSVSEIQGASAIVAPPGETLCTLPPSCYLGATKTKIKQCQ